MTINLESRNTCNTKHTPGPWHVHRLGSYTHINAVGNYPLADVYGGMSEPTVCEANARLIAAAPQLLEALEECMKDTFTAADGMTQSGAMSPAGARYQKAIEAICSAKGETL